MRQFFLEHLKDDSSVRLALVPVSEYPAVELHFLLLPILRICNSDSGPTTLQVAISLAYVIHSSDMDRWRGQSLAFLLNVPLCLFFCLSTELPFVFGSFVLVITDLLKWKVFVLINLN